MAQSYKFHALNPSQVGNFFKISIAVAAKAAKAVRNDVSITWEGGRELRTVYR